MTAARSVADVREHPILFKGRLVRAILAGTKTQTRRIVKPQPEPNAYGSHSWPSHLAQTMVEPRDMGCLGPFGSRGDRLWVREMHAFLDPDFRPTLMTDRGHVRVSYRADHAVDPQHGDGPDQLRWRPSIHMPRWASRITLEVTDVRVERLQALTEEDAKAEGVYFDGTYWRGADHPIKGFPKCFPFAWQAFESLWDSINEKRAPWASNPWVWVVSFRKVTP